MASQISTAPKIRVKRHFRDLLTILATLFFINISSASNNTLLLSQYSFKFEKNALFRVSENNGKEIFSGFFQLNNMLQWGKSIKSVDNNGVLTYKSIYKDSKNRECEVTQRFYSTSNSIRWEIELFSSDDAWTTELESAILFNDMQKQDFWLPYTGEILPNGKWSNPFIAIPITNRVFEYGRSFSVPLFSILNREKDSAFSFIFSPEDTNIYTNIKMEKYGDATGFKINRESIRLGEKKVVKFSQDIITHPADWRGGLEWITSRYPKYFEPKNSFAEEVAGGAAYSASEELPDVNKMRSMAFSVNWRARFDWPYIGMSYPLVKDSTTPWRCSDVDPNGDKIEGQETYMTFKEMDDYAKEMKDNGFHVLNYFSTTEWGLGMKSIDSVKWDMGEDEMWKDCTTFGYRKIKDGLLIKSSSWGGAIGMDCGGADYKTFLLDQAKRHIKYLPNYSGICIDRLDWLNRVVTTRDDGAGFYNNKKGASVRLAWYELMEELTKIIHSANHVVFANPCSGGYRLEVSQYLDGIYDEFAMNGDALNKSAFLCLKKPLMAWTPGMGLREQNTPKDGADQFFQRHLLMGAFPTVPFPKNDHTINPSPEMDSLYIAYGEMFNLLKGRKWVLTPHCVEVEKGDALANLFKINNGYILPIVFGSDSAQIEISIANLPELKNLKCRIYYPNSKKTTKISFKKDNERYNATIPLKHGCAMVKFEAF